MIAPQLLTSEIGKTLPQKGRHQTQRLDPDGALVPFTRSIPSSTLYSVDQSFNSSHMFSHVVILWADPSKSEAADQIVAAAEKYLKSIPGILNFHVGRMVRSHRGVVDQTYQVALNIQFATKQTQDEYQDHPQHLQFVSECRPLFAKVVVYDFE